MVEPITLAAVGSVAITEGIKFLYNQGGELLKRWRARSDKRAESETAQAPAEEPVQLNLPAAFEGDSREAKIHFEALDQVEEQLRGIRKDLSEYAEGIEPVDSKDEDLLKKVDALRQLIEAVYQQRLTFKGEQRGLGPTVEGNIDVKRVVGYSAAVRAGQVRSGVVTGNAKADQVDGTLVGVDIDTIGD
jgi:hypothetical protein